MRYILRRNVELVGSIDAMEMVERVRVVRQS